MSAKTAEPIYVSNLELDEAEDHVTIMFLDATDGKDCYSIATVYGDGRVIVQPYYTDDAIRISLPINLTVKASQS